MTIPNEPPGPSAMGDPCLTEDQHASVRVPVLFLLAVVMCGALGSGCFVIRGERRVKPDSQGPTIELHRAAGPIYCRAVDSRDFKMDIGVANGQARWELQFLLNILPVHIYRIKETTWPLSAYLEFEPKSSGITFDPWQIFFQATNQVRVPPTRIWQEDLFLATNKTEALLVTNHTTFQLEFATSGQGYLDQDSPFQLSIEGISISGRDVALPPIHFEPATAVRPGFRLPY